MHFALTSAAVHLCGLTAHLHEEQTSKGVFVVTQCLLRSMHGAYVACMQSNLEIFDEIKHVLTSSVCFHHYHTR